MYTYWPWPTFSKSKVWNCNISETVRPSKHSWNYFKYPPFYQHFSFLTCKWSLGYSCRFASTWVTSPSSCSCWRLWGFSKLSPQYCRQYNHTGTTIGHGSWRHETENISTSTGYVAWLARASTAVLLPELGVGTLLPTWRRHFPANLTWALCCPRGVNTLLSTWRGKFAAHWAWSLCYPPGVSTLLPTGRGQFATHWEWTLAARWAWPLCCQLSVSTLWPTGRGHFAAHWRAMSSIRVDTSTGNLLPISVGTPTGTPTGKVGGNAWAP